jgi:DNA-binding CsgD family transcriptional regulator
MFTIRPVEITPGFITGEGARPRAAGRHVACREKVPGGLTRREVDVLVLLARGYSNPEIAARLFISRKTVSAHLEHIYSKLGVTTRTRAAFFAMQQGFVAVQGEDAAGSGSRGHRALAPTRGGPVLGA